MCLYLTKRNGTYYFRRVIPPELRSFFDGASEFIFSLRTKERSLAKQRRSEEALRTDQRLRQARGEALDLSQDPVPSPILVPKGEASSRLEDTNRSTPLLSGSASHSRRRGVMLHTTVVSLWAAERKPREKSVDTYRRAAERFDSLVGKPLAHITKSDVVRFKQSLLTSGVSVSNARCLLSRIKALLNHASNNDMIPANPAAGVSIAASKKDSTQKRKPFALDDLKLIFSSPIYMEGKRPVQGKGEAAYWLPLLALFTGARLEELGQLRLQDISVYSLTDNDGKGSTALCLWLREDETDNLELKTENSARVIPVHPTLIALGFVPYVQSLRDKNAYWLFPELKPGTYGKRTAKWGQWFSKFLREDCGISDKKLVFHSFRHSFKDLLRRARIEEGVQRQLMGHAGRHVADNYGEGYSLYQLVTAIHSVRVPGLKIVGIEC